MRELPLFASAPLAATVINGALALSVFLRDPKNRYNRVFALMCSAFAVWSFGYLLMFFVRSRNEAFDALQVLHFGLVFIVPTGYHFVLTLTDDERRWRWRLCQATYVAAVIFLILGFARLFDAGLHRRFNSWFPIAGPANPFFDLGFLGAFTAYTAYLLWRKVRTTESMVQRLRAQWVLIGFILCIIGSSTNIMLVHGIYIYPFGHLTNILYTMIIAYTIVKHQLVDVDYAVKRGLVYTLLSGLIAGVFIGGILLAQTVIERVTGYTSIVVTAAVGVAIALLIQPAKDRFTTLVEASFFRSTYDYQQTLRQFSADVATMLDLAPLLEELVTTVCDAMRLDAVCLMLSDPRTSRFRVEQTTGPRAPAAVGVELDGGHALVRWLAMNRRELFRDEVVRASSFTAIRHQLVSVLDQTRATTCFPLFSGADLIGMLLLGEKLSGEAFTPDDIRLLSTLANQAAVAVRNARLVGNIRALQQYSDMVISATPIGVYTIDASYHVRTWNPVMEVLEQLPAAQVVGRDIRTEMPVPRPDGWLSWTADVLERGEAVEQFDVRKPAPGRGGAAIVNLKISPLRDASHEVTGAVIIVEDVTERRYLETRLIQADRLASVGVLAAGVAHEINNPLTGILGFAEFVLEDLGKDHPSWQDVKTIEENALRCQRIVRNLLEFSRQSGSFATHVSIEDVLEKTLSLIEHSTNKQGVTMVRNYHGDLPLLVADASKISQVFMNLLVNAIQAMRDGGRITITTSLHADMVAIEFADTGCGIPAEELHRVFDPFYSTKPQGEGTGLGLSISTGIVEQHGGNITVDSVPGQGTRFTVCLPVPKEKLPVIEPEDSLEPTLSPA